MLSLLLAATTSLNPIATSSEYTGSGGIVTQSGTLVGSGFTLPPFLIEAQAWWEEEGTALASSLESYEENRSLYNKLHERAAKRKAILRRSCRRDMRKANRDQTLPTALRCLRGEFTLELSLLRKEKESLNMFPLPGERTGTIAALETLSEAIVTIVNAIDRKVYRSVDELPGTKEKLLESYRLPYRNAHKSLRNAHLLLSTRILLSHFGSLLSTSHLPLEAQPFQGKSWAKWGPPPNADLLLQQASCLFAASSHPAPLLSALPPCLTILPPEEKT